MWFVAAALASETPEVPPDPWDREVRGVELLVIQPVIKRLLFLEKKPDVRWAAPVEGVIGHAAFRLVDDGPPEDQWIVMVSAYMDRTGDGVDDPSNVLLGLFGGYDLKFIWEPLPTFATVYRDEHSRWIARVPIPMSPDEVDVLMAEVKRAWDLGSAHELGGYWFFTENCSTEITEVVDLALFGKPRELNYPYTLPRKYKRHGRATPLVDVVHPDEAHARQFAENWAIPPSLLVRCPDGDAACARAWVDTARTTYGDAWIEQLARWSRRRAYERAWSPELLAELARVREAARE